MRRFNSTRRHSRPPNRVTLVEEREASEKEPVKEYNDDVLVTHLDTPPPCFEFVLGADHWVASGGPHLPRLSGAGRDSGGHDLRGGVEVP